MWLSTGSILRCFIFGVSGGDGLTTAGRLRTTGGGGVMP